MGISANEVKNLREKTGAGMMDCKSALAEAGGDMEKAILILREKGLAGVQKRAGRIAAEGMATCLVEGPRGLLVEVNCETDFVAKNEEFREFVSAVATHIMANSHHNDQAVDNADESLKNEPWVHNASRTMGDILADKIAKTGENMKIRRFTSYVAKKGGIASYIHGGGRIGVLVEYSTDVDSENVRETVRDVAMHVAAINPAYLDRNSVTEDDLKREEALYRKQVLEQGKPEKIVDKIVAGKMGKFYSEVCLLEQPFVKEPTMKVQKYLEEQGKKLGTPITIVRYCRFQVGEGLE